MRQSLSFQLKSLIHATYRSPLYPPAEALADRSDAVGGHTLDDVLGIWDDERNVLSVCQSTNEGTGAELIDLRVRSAVQVQCDTKALVSRLVAPPQHGRIVTTHLGTTNAVWCRTIELVQNQTVYRVGTVVDTGRQDVDTKHVLLGWAETELRTGAVDLRTNVHGGTSLVGRDVLGVEGDSCLDSIEEELDRHGRDADSLGRVLHPHGIAVGAEHLDIARGGTECLEALVGLLPVVQGRRHAVDTDEGIGDELGSRPFPGFDGIMGFDVAVHLSTGDKYGVRITVLSI